MNKKKCYQCELNMIKIAADAIYKSGIGNDCSKLVKLNFLTFYEDYLTTQKNTLENNTVILAFICDEHIKDFNFAQPINSRINVIKECLENENARVNNRIERLNKEIDAHAPQSIIDKENELITKSYINITLLDYYLKKYKKASRPSPEEKLLKAIFGE